MTFNTTLSLWENIKSGLWASGRTPEQMANELGTTQGSIKTAIGNRFKRKGKTPPLHKSVFDYLEEHCIGFREYAEENDITVASIDPV
ncbi:hypothetical protein WCX72_09855 [Sulfurimonas sp. HSL1-6]|uniref:hypothetical protein n=1 Tax=Sulfurimonadaceae TaxID=2771471 RepID=UPI0031F72552